MEAQSMEARISRLESDTHHIQLHVRDLREDMKGLRQETKELNQKIDTKFGELSLGRVWDRVWMLLSMGALLGVMARGFKWI